MNDRPRIVVISEPGSAGVKRHVVDLLRLIDVMRFEVYFIYSLERSDATYQTEITELSTRGITCIEIPMNAPLSVRKDTAALMTLIGELRRIRPHLIHSHSSKAGGLARIASLCLFPRPRNVYTPNAMACHRSSLYWGIEVVLGLLTDRLVAVSRTEFADWQRWRIPGAKRAAIIPNGMSVRTSETVGHREIPHNAEWTFGACGRICRQKNSLLMFRTAVEMLRRDSQARFVWIGDFGDDDEAQSVRTFLSQEKEFGDRLRVTGWVSDPESLLLTLDVFCMISRYEGLSYVLGEAQLLALPVLAVDAPGISDLVVQDVTGIVALPQIESLCDALTGLRDDVELRRRLGEKARREIALHYTVAGMVAAVEDVYEQLTPQRSSTTLDATTV
ncbi:MAG: Exopolysaccharide biosynthesis glycosyltransferase EpsF [Schlesneria sp.]|nr:Exopolysaccharide biosynthesis glycosyltransferase EpsF [Schlesneria sp.]